MRFNATNFGTIELKDDAGVLIETIPNTWDVKSQGTNTIVIRNHAGRKMYKLPYTSCKSNGGVALGGTLAATLAALEAGYFCDIINQSILDLVTGGTEEASDLTAIEGKVDAVIGQQGDIASRSFQQTILAMIDTPDAVNSSLGDITVTGYDSSGIRADADGSVLEREENIQLIMAEGRDVWYVDGILLAGGDGTSWNDAFDTITEAVTAAADGDIIRIRGEFDEGATILLDKELWLIGDNTSSNQYNTLIYNNTGVYPIITVKDHMCRIFNLGFAQMQAAPVIQFGDAGGQSWYKVHIKDCKFDGWNTATYGISYFDASVDAPDLHVEGCLFRSYAGTEIVGNATRGRYNNNIFLATAANICFEHVQNGGDRPDTMIIDNLFIGVNSTDTGIKITNTPTAGTYTIAGNKILNFATPITNKANNVYTVVNNVTFDESASIPRIATVATVDGSSTAWTQAAHRLFTVTGAALVRVFGVVTETLVGAATLEVGVAGATAGLIAQVANATTLAAGDILANSGTATLVPLGQTNDYALVSGIDIDILVGGANVTDGQITFYCQWLPVSQGATVVAAAWD